jgi:hypothetical protein
VAPASTTYKRRRVSRLETGRKFKGARAQLVVGRRSRCLRRRCCCCRSLRRRPCSGGLAPGCEPQTSSRCCANNWRLNQQVSGAGSTTSTLICYRASRRPAARRTLAQPVPLGHPTLVVVRRPAFALVVFRRRRPRRWLNDNNDGRGAPDMPSGEPTTLISRPLPDNCLSPSVGSRAAGQLIRGSSRPSARLVC